MKRTKSDLDLDLVNRSRESRESDDEVFSTQVATEMALKDEGGQQSPEDTIRPISNHHLRPRKRTAVRQFLSSGTRKRKPRSSPQKSIDLSMNDVSERNSRHIVADHERTARNDEEMEAVAQETVDNEDSIGILRPKTDTEMRLRGDQISYCAQRAERRRRKQLQRRLHEERKNIPTSYSAAIMRISDQRFELPKIRTPEEWASLHAQQEAATKKRHEEWDNWFDKSSDSESERSEASSSPRKGRPSGPSKRRKRRRRTKNEK